MPLASLASLVWLAACQARPVAEVGAEVLPGLPLAAAFPGAAAMLAGFDPPAAAAPWRAGDEVLFGLRLRRDGRERHWLLHLRLTEPAALGRAGEGAPLLSPLPPVDWSMRVNGEDRSFASARCRAIATVADADGHVLGRSEPLLPRDFLAGGFARACELVALRRQNLPAGQAVVGDTFYRDLDLQPFAEATVAAVALLQVVQEDDVLAPLLWEVVDKPSVWSVVSHLGARVTLRPRFHAAVLMASPVATAPVAWRVPLDLVVNDQEALHTELFVAPAARPLALCGGVVGAAARHPREEGREFAIVLLAARCGRPAAR
jgi:hypothetical protein